jgi:hypothetical protein
MKEIKGYNGDYLIYEDGRVYSNKSNLFLKFGKNTSGYLQVNLWNKNKPKTKFVHHLVAESYLNHKPNGQTLVIDHIDNNKLNNKVENLQLITQRENSYKRNKSMNKTVGVYWSTQNKKWQVRPRVNNRKHFVGYFDCKNTAQMIYFDFCKYIDSIPSIREMSVLEIKEKIKEYKAKINSLN